MLKLICGGVIAVSLAYIGLGIKKYYKARAKLFEDCLKFVELLCDEISYAKPTLDKIIDEFLAGNQSEFTNVLKKYRQGLADGKTASDIKISSKYLLQSERELLTDFLQNLGRFDAKTQLNNLAGYKVKIEKIKVRTEEKSNINGNMAFKLMVLAGIVVLIVLA